MSRAYGYIVRLDGLYVRSWATRKAADDYAKAMMAYGTEPERVTIQSVTDEDEWDFLHPRRSRRWRR